MRTIAFLIVAGASAGALAQPAPSKNIAPTDLEVTSTAFPANGRIPKEFSCQGKNISPPLAWSNVPTQAKSIAILVEDPDAPGGNFTHWVVSGIAPNVRSLPAGAALPSGAAAAENSKGNKGYTGVCPPAGALHHYHFRVFALDVPTVAASRTDLMQLVNAHEVAEGELIGTFQKG